MRPLLIDENVINEVSKLIIKAQENVLSIDDQLDMKNGEMPPIGDAQHLYIYFGFRCAYSQELHPVAGLLRHLSISVDKDLLPSVAHTDEIMKLFLFRNNIISGPTDEGFRFYFEDIGEGRQAINLVETIHDDDDDDDENK